MAINIDFSDPAAYTLSNWADQVDEETLQELGQTLCETVSLDAASRDGWLDECETWLDMASQVMENKSTPWEGASNIKFPLLSTAALQFHARAQQELLKGERIVKAKVLGKDPDGKKAQRAWRVQRAMSYQLLYHMEDWQEDTDRLLFVLPLVGTMFRKLYWSGTLNRPASELLLPSDIIVNYYATDWVRARKTHAFSYQRNQIIEMINMGLYSDIEVPERAEGPNEPEDQDDGEAPDAADAVAPEEDVPFPIYECHYWWDLDEDGYEEPYIITVLAQTEEVLRILPRFTPDKVEVKPDSTNIMRIIPQEYIHVYKFLPDVDSNIYGTGLGKLLGPTNAAIDTIINQLLDSGTLSTMPSGFFGKGIRLSRGGRIRLKPGEWRQVGVTGQDLGKNFFPIPTKEPSTVLFQLLGTLMQAGEKMGSVTEALTGENPGQNQPFATTSAVMQQGMQVFLGIYKRIYRSLTAEFRTLYDLNRMFLGPDTYTDMLDEPEGADVIQDFRVEGLDITPEADPSLANSIKKRERAQALIEARRAGIPLNDKYIARIFVESIDEPEPEAVLKVEPPPPSKDQLDHQAKMEELKLKKMEIMVAAQARSNDHKLALAKALEAIAKAKAQDAQGELKQLDAQLDMMMKQSEMELKEREFFQKLVLGEQQIAVNDAKTTAQANANSGGAS